MHLSYRYRAKLLMWWPTAGQDIDIIGSPQTWGKRFWLELKTTESISTKAFQGHELAIDLYQLREYGKQNIPDYYVFPTPEWVGVLGQTSSNAWLGGLAKERLAYQSHARDHWFAEWTWVVPGWAIRDALASQLSALPPSKPKRPQPQPYTVARIEAGVITWVSPELDEMPSLAWREFWKKMERCGDEDWPAQFLVQNVGHGPIVQRSVLASDLLQLAEGEVPFEGPVVRYGQSEKSSNAYVIQEPVADFGGLEFGSTALMSLSELALKAP